MLDRYYRSTCTAPGCEVFRTKGYAPAWHIGSAGRTTVTMAGLPPVLRVLLVSDGTVTKMLEAFYWEPVQVAAVTQRVLQAEASIAWLGVPAGAPVLARWVRLRGDNTGHHYANAFSLIRLDAIPAPLRSQLLAGSIGIGELIRACGLETYRELLEIGTTADLSLGGAYDDPPQDCIDRTYRISLGGQPALLVTECFPLQRFVRASQPRHSAV